MATRTVLWLRSATTTSRPGGWWTALYLGHLLRACVVPEGPLALASYGFDGRTGKNARSYQTLVPLAVFTGRNIRVFADAEERSEQIGRELLAAPELTGSTLVMAWEHRRLPTLAQHWRRRL